MAQVVKVVLVIDPPIAVAAELQTLGLVLDVRGVRSLTVVEDPLEELYGEW